MKLKYLQKPSEIWDEPLPKTEEYPRHWVTIVDIEVELSDGQILKVPKGEIWDGASVPRWLWWKWQPHGKVAFANFIHDILYGDKENQKKLYPKFGQARKFADQERIIWAYFLAPEELKETRQTNFWVRKLGWIFYRNLMKIPK